MSTDTRPAKKSARLRQLLAGDQLHVLMEPCRGLSEKSALGAGLKRTWARSLMLAFLSVAAFGPTVAAQPSLLNPLANVRVADSFPGGTLGDQIAAAFANLGTVRGEVWVFKEGAINRTVTIGEFQTLRFFAGVRTIAGGRFLLNGVRSTIQGAGCENTIFDVVSTVANGVIELASGEPAGTVEDLAIRFAQPDTNDRSQLIQYAPAISAVGQPRFRVRHVRISRAWNGIDMKGNSGGASIEDVQMSAFNVGVDIDGSLDSVRVVDLHFWPFDLTANQVGVFLVAPTVAIQSGRMDDLHISGLLNISALGIRLYQSAAGTTFGEVTNADFDTFQGISMSAGNLSLAGSFFSSNGTPWITQSGGQLSISGSNFFTGVGTADGINYSGGTGSSLTLSSCRFETTAADRRSIFSNGIDLTVSGCNFSRNPSIGYTAPTIDIASGRATLMGNRTRDKGPGPGTFIRVATDDWHRVVFNAPVGWLMDTPFPTFGIYGPN